MCKEHGDDVRGHMSKMTDELVTLLKQKVHSQGESTKPKRRRRRRGSRKKTSAKTHEDASVKKDKNIKTKKKRSRRRAKKSNNTIKQAKVTNEVKQKEAKPVNPRRTLYGGRRRSVTTDEVKESMVDR